MHVLLPWPLGGNTAGRMRPANYNRLPTAGPPRQCEIIGPRQSSPLTVHGQGGDDFGRDPGLVLRLDRPRSILSPCSTRQPEAEKAEENSMNKPPGFDLVERARA